MEARSGQNHDNKIAPQVNFTPTAAKIFCFNYMNTYFIHTTNHFSVVLKIILYFFLLLF